MKKSKVIYFFILFIISHGVAFGDDSQSGDLSDMIKQLQEQLTGQQDEIKELKKQIGNQQKNSLVIEDEIQNGSDLQSIGDIKPGENPVLEPAPTITDPDNKILQQGYGVIKDVVGVEFNEGIDGLTLKGDARFRYEARERERRGREDDSRDRYRIRLRLGAVWANLEDSWEIGVGLATGGVGVESATSTNQSFSKDGVFQTNEINLDYAYARHSWEYVDLTIGQQVNPWKKSTTYLMWDSDVRPVGVTGNYHYEDLFLTGGIYDVLGGEGSSGDNTEAVMLAAQVGYKAEVENMQFLIAGGLWYFNDTAYEAVNNFMNGGEEVDTDGDDVPDTSPRHAGPLNRKAQFTIGDIYTQFNTEVQEKIKLQAHAHVAMNFGADEKGGSQLGQRGINPEDEDLAWLIGGKASVDSVEFSIDFAHIEADSVFAPIKDSDFGDTAGLTVTDLEGIKLGLKYKFTKTFSLGGTYMDLSEIEGTSRDAQLYQLDLVYKF